MESRDSRSRSAYLCAFLSIVFFALNPVLVAGLSVPFDAMSILFWSLAVSTSFLLIVVLSVYRKLLGDILRNTTIKGWLFILCTSLIRMGATFCFFFAVLNSSRIEATILTLMWPIFFILFSFLIDKERPQLLEIILVIFSFSGAIIIISGNAQISVFDNQLFGLSIAVFAAVLGGIHSAIFKHFFKKFFTKDTFAIQTILILFRSMIGLLVTSAFFLLSDWPITLPQTNIDWLSMLLIGVLCYSCTQIFYCYALVKMDKIELSNIQYFNPVLVALFLSVFVGDQITSTFLLGTLIISSTQYILQSKVTFFTSMNATLLLSIPVVISVYIDNDDYNFLIHQEAPTLLGTVFAILIGFALSRIIDRNRLLDGKYLAINDAISSLLKGYPSKTRRDYVEKFLRQKNKNKNKNWIKSLQILFLFGFVFFFAYCAAQAIVHLWTSTNRIGVKNNHNMWYKM